MKAPRETNVRSSPTAVTTELLILPDGQVLVHNLTPAFADLLAELNPNDAQLRPRTTKGLTAPISSENIEHRTSNAERPIKTQSIRS